MPAHPRFVEAHRFEPGREPAGFQTVVQIWRAVSGLEQQSISAIDECFKVGANKAEVAQFFEEHSIPFKVLEVCGVGSV